MTLVRLSPKGSCACHLISICRNRHRHDRGRPVVCGVIATAISVVAKLPTAKESHVTSAVRLKTAHQIDCRSKQRKGRSGVRFGLSQLCSKTSYAFSIRSE